MVHIVEPKAANIVTVLGRDRGEYLLRRQDLICNFAIED